MRNFDPNNVVITFASLPIQGFADGSFIVIEPVSDAFNWVVGADGETARSKSMDKRRIARVTLLQTSDSNDVLSEIHRLDVEAANGAGIAAFTVTDLSGRTQCIEPQAFILRAPNVELGKEIGPREWVFGLPDPKWNVGGNA